MGILCFVVAGLILRMQLDDTPVWAYLLAIQFFIIGLFLILFGYDTFIHG